MHRGIGLIRCRPSNIDSCVENGDDHDGDENGDHAVGHHLHHLVLGHHCTVIDFKPAARGNGEDFEIEDRSTADLIYMILDTLGDADMTTDDIIDNTKFYAEELQKRFPVRDRMIETLLAALEKIKQEQQ